MLSLQNEASAATSWDSCLWSGEEERIFLKDHLYPALEAAGLAGKIAVFIWDHNKERAYARAVETIQEDTADLIEGVAFHFYTGDHFKALELLTRRFPDKKLFFTEGCMEYSRADIGKDVFAHALRYAHEYIGDIDHGTTMLFDWNMYLDQEGGPNHVRNFCSAPIMCDVNTKEIIRNPSQQAIALIGQTAVPGSTHIASVSGNSSTKDIPVSKSIQNSAVERASPSAEFLQTTDTDT